MADSSRRTKSANQRTKDATEETQTPEEAAAAAAGGVPEVPGPVETPEPEVEEPRRNPTKRQAEAAADRPSAEDALFSRDDHLDNAKAMHGHPRHIVAGALAHLDNEQEGSHVGAEMLSFRVVQDALNKFLAFSPVEQGEEDSDNTGGQS